MAKAQVDRDEKAGKIGAPSGADKRRSGRAPLVVRVDYSTVDTFFSEFTTNINEGGLFIETDAPAPIGTRVVLQFALPGTHDPLKLDGRVVWASPEGSAEAPGMGIEFENLDELSRRRINEVVRSLRSETGGARRA